MPPPPVPAVVLLAVLKAMVQSWSATEAVVAVVPVHQIAPPDVPAVLAVIVEF